jgi:hypothetical protein
VASSSVASGNSAAVSSTSTESFMLRAGGYQAPKAPDLMSYRARPLQCALPGCAFASVRPHRIRRTRRRRVCAEGGNGGEGEDASSSWREYDDACEVRAVPSAFRDVITERIQRRGTSNLDDTAANP